MGHVLGMPSRAQQSQRGGQACSWDAPALPRPPPQPATVMLLSPFSPRKPPPLPHGAQRHTVRSSWRVRASSWLRPHLVEHGQLPAAAGPSGWPPTCHPTHKASRWCPLRSGP